MQRFEFQGFEILAGQSAAENDELTFKVASPRDLWLHASGYSGSHVVVRGDAPREVLEKAAQLAAFHSKAREAGGKVTVTYCRVSDVKKPPGFPPGKVQLKRSQSLKVYPRDPFL